MTASEKIESFLRGHAGAAYCDDCLSSNLDIHPRQQVQQKTSHLAKITATGVRTASVLGVAEAKR